MRGACKSRARRSHLPPSKASQDKRATTSKSPERPPSHGGQSSAGQDSARDKAPLQRNKRPLDLASTNNSSPAKRARPTRADGHAQPLRRSAKLEKQHSACSVNSNGLSRASSEHTGQATKTPQQPEPPKRPFPNEARAGNQEQVSEPSLLRKRQVYGEGHDKEPQLKRARLTRENLAEFSKMAKKGATNASIPPAPESTVESSVTKTTIRTTWTTTSGFAIQAYENGVLPSALSKPPTNLEDIRERFARSRATASPPEAEYGRYVNKVERAPNESTMVFETSGRLLKNYDDEGYTRVFNQAFTGFPKDVGFNNGLSTPQPDFVEGPGMTDYRPFPVHKRVSGAVLYKDDPFSVTLPHLAGEWKGRGKDMEEARLQSAYDGAALVYARNQALSYLGTPNPPGHAEVITFTTDGTNLNLFAHYAAPSTDGTVEYHQYPIESANLVGSHQGFKDSRRALRNEQDHVRQWSYALRDQLKEHWQQHRDAFHPVADQTGSPVANSSETNTHETEYVMGEQPCQPTPTASKSVSSSKSHPRVNDGGSSSGPKRKAPWRQRSHEPARPRRKAQEYWKWDAKSERYYHKHSDGQVTWLEDSDDGNQIVSCLSPHGRVLGVRSKYRAIMHTFSHPLIWSRGRPGRHFIICPYCLWVLCIRSRLSFHATL